MVDIALKAVMFGVRAVRIRKSARRRYFHSSEIHHVWHWVTMGEMDDSIQVRLMYPGKDQFHEFTNF